MNSPAQHIDVNEAKWFAIRTQFRKEKYVAEQLRLDDIEAYVPLQRLKRKYKSRSKWVELPLIPNYVFVKITKADYLKVLKTFGFLSFIHFSGKIIPIPNSEIETLKMVVAEEEVLTISSDHFALGDWVEIRSGYLVGMKGQLIEEKGKSRFVVQLERLGFYLTIDVEQHLFRKTTAA